MPAGNGPVVVSYPVQMNCDVAVCVDGRGIAADLAHFAHDADVLVGELLQVGGVDAGGCFGHCGHQKNCWVIVFLNAVRVLRWRCGRLMCGWTSRLWKTCRRAKWVNRVWTFTQNYGHVKHWRIHLMASILSLRDQSQLPPK